MNWELKAIYRNATGSDRRQHYYRGVQQAEAYMSQQAELREGNREP